MARQATGTAFEDDGRWYVRLSLGPGPDGKPLRPAFPLPWCSDRAAAEERRDGLAALVRRLRAAGQETVLTKVLPEAARAPVEGWPTFVALVDAIERGQVAPPAAAPQFETFEHVGRRWTSGELARSYPDFVKAKRSVQDDKERLEKLYQVIGGVPVKAFTLRHYTDAMGALPPSARTPATRRQYAQLIHRVLALAVWPLQLTTVHPMPKGAMPKPGGDKAKGYLFPAEEAQLVGCPKVPLERRFLYGFLAREGCRASEAAGLAWRDLDLVTGEVHLDRNKTDDPRAWALDPGVWRALVAWRAVRASEPPEASVFVRAGGLPLSTSRLAEGLRRDLLRAGVDRPQLFERSEQRQQLRAHDLRGTFVTLSLALGRAEVWVTDRTGHGSSEMVAGYTRAARSAKERSLGWLVDLDRALGMQVDQSSVPGGSIVSGEGGGSGKAEQKEPLAEVAEWQTQRIQNLLIALREGPRRGETAAATDAEVRQTTPPDDCLTIEGRAVILAGRVIEALLQGDHATATLLADRLLELLEGLVDE
jgi:integrase